MVLEGACEHDRTHEHADQADEADHGGDDDPSGYVIDDSENNAAEEEHERGNERSDRVGPCLKGELAGLGR